MAYQKAARTERECDIHGRTEFSERIVGQAQTRVFRCLKCDSERQLERYHAKQDGTFEPTYNKQAVVKHKDYGFCNDHFLAKNALGECAGRED